MPLTFNDVPDWDSWENQGGNIAVATLQGAPALFVLRVDRTQPGPNRAFYRVGFGLNAAGGIDDVGRGEPRQPVDGSERSRESLLVECTQVVEDPGWSDVTIVVGEEENLPCRLQRPTVTGRGRPRIRLCDEANR